MNELFQVLNFKKHTIMGGLCSTHIQKTNLNEVLRLITRNKIHSEIFISNQETETIKFYLVPSLH